MWHCWVSVFMFVMPLSVCVVFTNKSKIKCLTGHSQNTSTRYLHSLSLKNKNTILLLEEKQITEVLSLRSDGRFDSDNTFWCRLLRDEAPLQSVELKSVFLSMCWGEIISFWVWTGLFRAADCADEGCLILLIKGNVPRSAVLSYLRPCFVIDIFFWTFNKQRHLKLWSYRTNISGFSFSFSLCIGNKNLLSRFRLIFYKKCFIIYSEIIVLIIF